MGSKHGEELGCSEVTIQERAERYNAAFPQFPDSHFKISDRWISATWILGNDYRGSGYYGSYPPGYMPRVSSLFPDTQRPLHLFGGSLRVDTAVHPRGVTVDLRVTAKVKPRVQADALALPFRIHSFDVCFADTPYSDLDAERYATPMPDRRMVLYEAHRVVSHGGYLIWMDTTLPMYRKDMWHWCGAISLWRSTNHRIRGVSIFERV